MVSRGQIMFAAFTNILMASCRHGKLVTPFGSLPDCPHDVLPFRAVWTDMGTINAKRDQMCSLMTRRVVHKIHSVFDHQRPIESDKVRRIICRSCGTALEIPPDAGKRKRHVGPCFASRRVDFMQPLNHSIFKFHCVNDAKKIYTCQQLLLKKNPAEKLAIMAGRGRSGFYAVTRQANELTSSPKNRRNTFILLLQKFMCIFKCI